MDIGDVDVTSCALPTGAATAAKQPALGTAGTASTDVITVQGIASMTPLLATVTQSGTWNIGTVTTVSEVTAITNALPAGTNNIGDVDVLSLPALPAGTNNIGDVDVLSLPALPAGTNNIGDVDVLSLPALPTGTNSIGSIAAGTTGGGSSYSFLSTAAVQAVQVKGSAGQVYSMQFFNNSATVAYARLYDQTGAPGSGDAANIVWRGMIPASTAGAGFTVTFPFGKAFSTGIGLRVSAAIADNDTTALSANVVTGNVDYK